MVSSGRHQLASRRVLDTKHIFKGHPLLRLQKESKRHLGKEQFILNIVSNRNIGELNKLHTTSFLTYRSATNTKQPSLCAQRNVNFS